MIICILANDVGFFLNTQLYKWIILNVENIQEVPQHLILLRVLLKQDLCDEYLGVRITAGHAVC